MNSICVLKYCHGKIPTAFWFPFLFLILLSCSQKETGSQRGDDPRQPDIPFYADNDIAMTVCSLVDALRVGEPLDSGDYNYVGVLTDGQGTPLYTDIEGAPGQWRVAVEDPKQASIRNCRVGDLMAADLRRYIVSALGLNHADLATTYENPHKEGEWIWTYDAGDVKVSFAEIEAKSPSGAEGSLLAITLLKDK